MICCFFAAFAARLAREDGGRVLRSRRRFRRREHGIERNDDKPGCEQRDVQSRSARVPIRSECDAIAAWRRHIDDLTKRSDYLNRKHYAALHFMAPGTDLTIGLPAGHLWVSGATRSKRGIAFTANVPTEEVFTVPHKDQTQGFVTASKPLSYQGSLIQNFRLTFDQGRVVALSAEKGEAELRKIIEADENAGRLGEVSLVPDRSPISQSGLIFYNTLFDENAADHIALGSALKFTLRDGPSMSDEEFSQVGGNHSLVHVDFMIGSAQMQVDGLTPAGRAEPIMRSGEWAFQV